ncbi:MAG: hypoxanthine phosphoribosyltransferase [Dehalococcoidia bacterium]
MKPSPKLEVLFSREEIRGAIERLAAHIQRDYQGKSPLLVGILKGSFMFMADLVRLLDLPLQIEFVRLASYGSGTETSGRIRLVSRVQCPMRGRDVLVVEDIIDTGLTVAYLLERLRREKPASLRLCALVDKPERRRVPVAIDYLGLTAPNRFLVGYGLDWDEGFRHLPDICVMEGGP